MVRSVAIAILCTMGLAANHLPLLWMSYLSYNARYATFYCINPRTDCHGSCTMGRSYVDAQRSLGEQNTHMPSTVVESVSELSNFLAFELDMPLPPPKEWSIRERNSEVALLMPLDPLDKPPRG
jgi:hypothetical protein